MPFKSVKGELDEFKTGNLHSGSKTGPVVTNRKQAIAIALSEQRKAQGQPPRQRGMPGLNQARHDLADIRRSTLPKGKRYGQ